MLPQLTAEESMQQVDRVALASGHMKADAADTLIRKWSETVNRGRQPAVKVNVKDPASQRDLSRMGIGVRRVPKVQPGSPA